MQSDRLRAVAAPFGRTLSDDEARRLVRFFDLLLLWNQRINLTGARNLEELATEHLPDSFALDALVGPGVTLLEVGAGGGLPALPFSILRPDVRLTLLEPRTRRAAFLRTALREVGAAGTVEVGRLEDVQTGFDVLSSRAVFPPAEWSERAIPHLHPGGRVVVFLGDGQAWQPGPGLVEVDRVAYQAGGRSRTALALVPAG